MLAVFTVTNLDDGLSYSNGYYYGAPGSLRDAIISANYLPGSDTIEFAPGLSGEILLENYALEIWDDVTITGPGAEVVTINANHTDRIFRTNNYSQSPEMKVSISGLTLTGGLTSGKGGAILSLQDLELVDCVLDGNAAGQSGGAIYSEGGQLTVVDSQISGNYSDSHGGGIYAKDGDISIANSLISGNESNNRGGGIFSRDGELSITSSWIQNNYAWYAGGVGKQGGNLTLAGSLVSGNQAVDGGALHCEECQLVSVTDSVLSGNTARYSGGAIYLEKSDTIISGSMVSGNHAGVGGGGIDSNYGALSITNSLITDNSVSSDYDDGYGSGGGVRQYEGSLTIAGVTISGNTARFDGAGVLASTDRSGSLVVRIAHSTITGNIVLEHGDYANAGGGIHLRRNSSLELDHTIVSVNEDLGGTATDVGNDSLLPNSITARYSLIGDNTGSVLAEAPLGSPDADGNLIGDPNGSGVIDALLGPLADNGGWTDTHALLPGSPALNAGDPLAEAGVGDVPTFDQRGMPFDRVSGGRIDIGAFEAQVALPALLGDYNENGVVDSADYSMWRDSLGDEVDFYAGADGSGNGIVDEPDFYVWRSHFGETLSEGAGSAAVVSRLAAAVPQARDLPKVSLQRRDWSQSVFQQGSAASLAAESPVPAADNKALFIPSLDTEHRIAAPKPHALLNTKVPASNRPRFEQLLIDRLFTPADNTGKRSESDLLPDDLASVEAGDASAGALDVALEALTAGDDSGF